jgi:hypothetical protein
MPYLNGLSPIFIYFFDLLLSAVAKVKIKDQRMQMVTFRSTGNWFRTIAILALIPLVSSLGCNRGPSLVQVSGKVMVDGKPADGAVVLFHPESSEPGMVSSAVSDASGAINPVTGGEPGIPAGSYRVSVSWPDPAMKKEAGAVQFGSGDDRPAPDLLKGKYVSKERSGLSVVIDSSTEQLEPFELTTR